MSVEFEQMVFNVLPWMSRIFILMSSVEFVFALTENLFCAEFPFGEGSLLFFLRWNKNEKIFAYLNIY